MSVNFKYDKNGFQGANIFISENSDKGYEEFQSNCTTVMEHIFKDYAVGTIAPKEKKSRRTKGRGSYAIDDLDLVRTLILEGHVKHLHGVNTANDLKVYHFDKTDEIKQTIDEYYKTKGVNVELMAESDGLSEESNNASVAEETPAAEIDSAALDN